MVVITRPAGTGSTLARQVRSRGGVPLLLPGLALRAAADEAGAAIALRAALGDDVLVFTSPAAVRFAARLVPLHTRAVVCAVGQGTARALRRHGVAEPLAPRERQDSEGVLALSALAQLRSQRVSLIGAAGGRGLLRTELAARGAVLREIHVYRRTTPRWLRRQLAAVQALPAQARVLLSSAEALDNLRGGLPPSVFAALTGAVAVVSSERLAEAARAAGFERIVQADSAVSADLLAAAAR
jgi:uroporphyrinogen-III synthase